MSGNRDGNDWVPIVGGVVLGAGILALIYKMFLAGEKDPCVPGKGNYKPKTAAPYVCTCEKTKGALVSAEEAERRKQLALAKAQGAGGGRGGAGGSGAGSSGSTSGGVVRYVFGGTALLFGILALLHKYLGVLEPVLRVVGPLLESWGIHIGTDAAALLKARCKKPPKERPPYKDPQDPDPERCDTLRIDPCKRRWPLEDPKPN